MENLGIKSRSIGTGLKSLTGHLVSPILRVYAVRRLQGRLTQFSDPELEWLLAQAKMTPVDLLTRARGKASYRWLLVHMLLHFSMDPDRVVRHGWPAIRRAEGRCADCHSRGRCKRWIAWQRRNGAPTVFCPNATLFQALAEELDVSEGSL